MESVPIKETKLTNEDFLKTMSPSFTKDENLKQKQFDEIYEPHGELNESPLVSHYSSNINKDLPKLCSSGVIKVKLASASPEWNNKAEVEVSCDNADEVLEKMLKNIVHKFPIESVISVEKMPEEGKIIQNQIENMKVPMGYTQISPPQQLNQFDLLHVKTKIPEGMRSQTRLLRGGGGGNIVGYGKPVASNTGRIFYRPGSPLPPPPVMHSQQQGGMMMMSGLANTNPIFSKRVIGRQIIPPPIFQIPSPYTYDPMTVRRASKVVKKSVKEENTEGKSNLNNSNYSEKNSSLKSMRTNQTSLSKMNTKQSIPKNRFFAGIAGYGRPMTTSPTVNPPSVLRQGGTITGGVVYPSYPSVQMSTILPPYSSTIINYQDVNGNVEIGRERFPSKEEKILSQEEDVKSNRSKKFKDKSVSHLNTVESFSRKESTYNKSTSFNKKDVTNSNMNSENSNNTKTKSSGSQIGNSHISQLNPMIVEVPRFVPKIETRHIVKEVPKVEVEWVEKVLEIPQIQYVDKVEEVERFVEVVKHVPKYEILDVPCEKVKYVHKTETKLVEKFMEVPSKTARIPVPQPYIVDTPFVIPKFVDKEVSVVMSQNVIPQFQETNEILNVEVVKYVPYLVPVDVYVPKPVEVPIKKLESYEESKKIENLSLQQLQQLMVELNPHLQQLDQFNASQNDVFQNSIILSMNQAKTHGLSAPAPFSTPLITLDDQKNGVIEIAEAAKESQEDSNNFPTLYSNYYKPKQTINTNMNENASLSIQPTQQNHPENIKQDLQFTSQILNDEGEKSQGESQRGEEEMQEESNTERETNETLHSTAIEVI